MIFFILGWVGTMYGAYKYFNDPTGLKKYKNPKEQQVKRHLYYTNYNSLLHATLVSIFSKKSILIPTKFSSIFQANFFKVFCVFASMTMIITEDSTP